MIQLTSEAIAGFSDSLLRPKFDGALPIPTFHRELWDVCTSKDRFVAIAAPRGFGKSTAVTLTYLLAALLFRNKSYVLILSDTQSQSVQFLGDVKRELSDNEDLVALFGVKGFTKDTEDDIIVQFDDGHEFRVQAKGAEQKLRGLKWSNRRPDLILCDDLEGDEQVQSKDRRDKFRRWFFGAVIPSLSKDGQIRIVGTILHFDSLLQSFMPEAYCKGIKARYLKTDGIKTWADCYASWKAIKYRAHDPDFSKLLWPEKMGIKQLKELRTDYEDRGMLDVFYREYLNEPIDESTAFFKKEDLLPMDAEDRKKKLTYYITCDLAISETSRSDYTVFTVAGMDEQRKLYLVNVIKMKAAGDIIASTILELHKVYEPELFGVEAGMIQKAIWPFLQEKMMADGVFPKLKLLTVHGRNKMIRAGSILARMKAGAVRFDKESDWYADFENELLRFPRAIHDDQVDAWAHMGQLLDKMREGPSEADLLLLHYEEEMEELGEDSIDNRNAVTGY
ncbi:Archaeophage PsiM2, terminase large subunit [uncultured Caudovirales phage]|uniref:Archaeophage PsiM2, terminase large subunit n=1 Tax=uncultured Caudovirales phage TaxID=2100421 RepID=A0A6J5T8W5_9CAUD|nr:Archaeophage PsiM2, terminase large subunit [uncultured Caudovirales phage]